LEQQETFKNLPPAKKEREPAAGTAKELHHETTGSPA